MVDSKLAMAFASYWGICFLFYMFASPYFNDDISLTGIRVPYPELNQTECLSYSLSWVPGCSGILDCPKIQTKVDCEFQGCSWVSSCFGLSSQIPPDPVKGITFSKIFNSLLFVFFGFNLPFGTPFWLQLIISVWQFIVFIMGVVLIVGLVPGV